MLTLGLLTTGVWVWSGWTFARFNLNDGVVSPAWTVSHGQIEWCSASWLNPVRFESGGKGKFDTPDIRWDFSWGVGNHYRGTTSQYEYVRVPLWPFALLLCIAACVLLASASGIRLRRVSSGRCVWCGYNLGGLDADAKCPECGGMRKGVVT